MKTRFGFRPDFALGEHLEQQADHYLLALKVPSEKPVSNQKKLLQELVDSADSLLVVLQKLGLQEDIQLIKHLFSLSGKPLLSRSELISQVRDWSRATKRTLSDLKERTGKGGKPKNIAIHFLVMDLYNIYCIGTGRHDRVTKYSDGREHPYGGRFFDFVDTFLKNIGHEKQNVELGKATEQSLKSIPKTSPK